MSVDAHVGRRLAEARLGAGIGFNELAHVLGISAATLAAYELGRQRIAPAHLALIALRLDVPIETFFPGPQAIPQMEHRAEPPTALERAGLGATDLDRR
jgi:transcriptional regulator with XRE-family HTH domain